MKVNFLKMHLDAVLPKYSRTGDAGMDLVATSYEYDNSKDCHVYGTGIGVEIPVGYVGLLFPRSSITKYDLRLANSVGVIDSNYRGEIICKFKEHHYFEFKFDVGDKIAQLLIVPYPTIEPEWKDALSKTNRGEQGFGSSGS